MIRQTLRSSFGSKVTLNGTDTWFSSTDSAFDITTNLTLGGWFRPTRANNNNICICHSNSEDYELSFSTNNQWQSIYNSGGFKTLLGILSGSNEARWAFVVSTYDGTTYKLYINGAIVASFASTFTIQNTGHLGIGAREGANQRFLGGDIASVFIEKSNVMSSTAIQTEYMLGPGNHVVTANTVGYYLFAGNLNDSSGNGKNLTLNGTTPTYSTLAGTELSRGLRSST